MKLYEFAIVVAAETEHEAQGLLSDRISADPGDPIDERNLPKYGDIDDWAHVYKGKEYEKGVV